MYARQWLATSTYQPQAVASYAVNVSSTAGTATIDGVSNAASLDVVCSLTSLPVYEAWLPKYYFPASNRLLPPLHNTELSWCDVCVGVWAVHGVLMCTSVLAYPMIIV